MGIITKYLSNLKNYIFFKRENSVPLVDLYRTYRIGKSYFNNKFTAIEKRIRIKSHYKSIKFKENSNYSLLHQAIFDSNMNVVNIILSQKYVSDSDIINDDNNNLSVTPCHLAGLVNNPEILELLKNHGANMICRSKNEKLNLLHICSYSGSLKALDWCLYNVFNENYKSWINSSSEENWSPLHYACYHNKLDVASYLIDNGADLYLRNKQNLTPIELAVFKDNYELFHCLYLFHYNKDKLNEHETEQVFLIL